MSEGERLSLGLIPFLCPFCRSGFGVGVYTTNSPEACHYVAENCKANIIVVENHKQLQKILQVRPQYTKQTLSALSGCPFLR